MSKSISSLLKSLQSIAYFFDENHTLLKTALLKDASKSTLIANKILLEYHDVLLYLVAYPDNKIIYDLANNELSRITQYLKNNKIALNKIFENSGLPNTHMYSRFTHDFTNWLFQDKACSVSLYGFEEEHTPLYQLLKLTLPKIEQEITSAAEENEPLFQSLEINKENELPFLLSEFSNLNALPLVKDHLWESSKLLTDIHFKDENYSRTWNKLDTRSIYYHSEIIKKFDFNKLLNTPIPKGSILSSKQKKLLIDTIKKNLVLSMRETDPATYMDFESLHFYELDRGISIALFGMISERQFPICSYIGYTLFKNGYPASYGGSWITGETANFGINIFEPYRGGESGIKLIELLRVYHHTFGVSYFEIEPYQFGQDNPDGIKSGAFWFYYRFGFRPVDKKLAKLAESENKKIQTIKGYRSSEETLIKFTESNLALKLGDSNGLAFSGIQEKVSSYIKKNHHGNRIQAITVCTKEFTKKTLFKKANNKEEQVVFENLSLVAAALQIKKQDILQLLVEMIHTKPKDVIQYNLLLTQLIKKLK